MSLTYNHTTQKGENVQMGETLYADSGTRQENKFHLNVLEGSPKVLGEFHLLGRFQTFVRMLVGHFGRFGQYVVLKIVDL